MTAVTKIPAQTTELPSLRALGLEGWQPSHSLPDTIDLSTLHTALARAEASLRPADARHIAVAVDKLVTYGRAFNIHIADVKSLTAVYAETMGDVPPDLLVSAVARACKTWKWGNRLPMPADLREIISSELGERQRVTWTIKTAAWKAKMATKRVKLPPDPAMAAKADEFLARRRTNREAPVVEPFDVDPNLQAQWSKMADECGL